jgi:FkbM family methyltransferase
MAAEDNVDRVVRDAFFAGVKNGVLVEVGAAMPDYLSIGASFRGLGWKVISIEPNPDFCAAHRALGSEILQYAASDTEADDVDFFVVDSRGTEYREGAVSFESFSSLGIKDQFADLYETVRAKTGISTIPVKVRRLDTILATHEPDLRAIDILAVDVEGWELNVMRGLTHYRPDVVIMENNFDSAEYVAFMTARGYRRWRRLEPNDIYVGPGIRRRGFARRIRGLFGAKVRSSSIPGHPYVVRLDRSEAIQRAMAEGAHEPKQTQWVTSILKPGARFVDIGASFGHYTALASHIVGPTGQVFAFEPSPLPHGTLAAMIADNDIANIHLVRSAVGDSSGQIDIYLPPRTDPIHSPSAFTAGEGFSPCRVPIVALDDFAPLNDGVTIDLIKIDVEGYEPNVIAGMRGLIERGLVRNMMCEFNSGWLRRNRETTPSPLAPSCPSSNRSIVKLVSSGPPRSVNDVEDRLDGSPPGCASKAVYRGGIGAPGSNSGNRSMR